jgi:hypothetical protein
MTEAEKQARAAAKTQRRDAKEAKTRAALTALFFMALPWLVGVAVFAATWRFVIQPVIHYHSLSVACGARDMNACSLLKQY